MNDKTYMINRLITKSYLKACERACGELKEETKTTEEEKNSSEKEE